MFEQRYSTAKCTRPDVAEPTQLVAAEVRAPTKRTWKDMDSSFAFSQQTADDGIGFVPLDLDSLEIVARTTKTQLRWPMAGDECRIREFQLIPVAIGFCTVVLASDGKHCKMLHIGGAHLYM